MNPLISIIVPVYNVEKYLDSCLKSLCNQSYKNIEIILVDDGATDNSGKMCDDWTKKDSRIVAYHKKNGGLSDARNYGIPYANGDIIAFVDSDDIVSENMISYLYDLMVKEDADISICDPAHFYPDKENKFEEGTFTKSFNSEDAICEMLYQTSFLVSAWAKLYKKSVFNDVLFPVGMLFEDSAVMYKLFYNVNKVAYGNGKLYGYMHRENSITTAQFSKRDLDILTICKEMRDFAKDKSERIQNAVMSYSVVGALRVFLNAPKTDEYKDVIKESETFIKENGNRILRDPYCRRKLKISILLFKTSKKLMREIYSRVDRWK